MTGLTRLGALLEREKKGGNKMPNFMPEENDEYYKQVGKYALLAAGAAGAIYGGYKYLGPHKFDGQPYDLVFLRPITKHGRELAEIFINEQLKTRNIQYRKLEDKLFIRIFAYRPHIQKAKDLRTAKMYYEHFVEGRRR